MGASGPEEGSVEVVREFDHDGLAFDVRDEGPREGECVVLLHGFPQDAGSWSGVAPRLAEAGLRVLAPDLRGYSPRARPRGRRAYHLDVLAGDVVALLDAAGVERAHVVGHDWGGALGWRVVARHPERVRTLTAVSTPHPAAFAWAMWRSDQALRSWYMLAVQLPWLPEAVLGRGVARGGLERLGLDAEHTRAYAERMSQPGALSGALGWYRGMFTRRSRPAARTRGRGAAGTGSAVAVPTTYVWGRRDPYLGAAAALRTARYCTGDYRFVALDADHWLPEKNPDDVARLVLERVAAG